MADSGHPVALKCTRCEREHFVLRYQGCVCPKGDCSGILEGKTLDELR